DIRYVATTIGSTNLTRSRTPLAPLKTPSAAAGLRTDWYATATPAASMTAEAQNGYQPPRSPPGTPLAETGSAPSLVSNMATAAISTKIAAVATWYGRNSAC